VPIGGTVGGFIGLTEGGSIGQTFGPHMGFKSMAFSQIGWFLPLMHVQ
jgi:hypothetical protein